MKSMMGEKPMGTGAKVAGMISKNASEAPFRVAQEAHTKKDAVRFDRTYTGAEWPTSVPAPVQPTPMRPLFKHDGMPGERE